MRRYAFLAYGAGFLLIALGGSRFLTIYLPGESWFSVGAGFGWIAAMCAPRGQS
jgi:hypothetical protein